MTENTPPARQPQRSPAAAAAPHRVMAYVDGFNLYHGLHQRHGRRFLWLDLQALAQQLLRPGQTLTGMHYFTARVRNQPPAERHQALYLDALTAHCPLLTVVEGRFQAKTYQCRSCGHERTLYEEKETDVSIAVQVVEDAVLDRYDTALLISADSDLCPAVRATRRVAPGKRILAAFPPRRHSEELRKTADVTMRINDAHLRRSQLPAIVTSPGGAILRRPRYWT